MTYNTSRPKLIIPEYGRQVQKMADYLLTIEDREKRNEQAQAVIDIMGILNPQVRDVEDFKHKLWDHLMIMSDFRLDVDAPYPLPKREQFQEKPQPMPYPPNYRKYRHYGHVIREMIKYATEQEAGERKEQLKMAIANHMKKIYLIWNKDTVDDEVILQEMNELAEGKLELDEMDLKDKRELVGRTNKNYKNKGRNYKNKGQNKGRNYKNKGRNYRKN